MGSNGYPEVRVCFIAMPFLLGSPQSEASFEIESVFALSSRVL